MIRRAIQFLTSGVPVSLRRGVPSVVVLAAARSDYYGPLFTRKTLTRFGSVISLAVLCTAAMATQGAQAVTLVNPDGSEAQPYQQWVNSSHLRTPDLKIVVHSNLDRCPPNSDGCFSYPTGISVGSSVAWWSKNVTFHELGHAVDQYCLEWPLRHRLKPLLGFPRSTPWIAPGTAGPSEFFAEAYRQIATYPTWEAWQAADQVQPYGTFTKSYGYVPAKATWMPIARIVRQAISRKKINGKRTYCKPDLATRT